MKKLKVLYFLSTMFLAIGSASFLFMPIARDLSSGTNKAPLLINGLMFWVPFILGYVFVFFANIQRKIINGVKVNGKPGMINFCSNKYATIFDFLLIISFVSLVVLFVLHQGESYITFVVLFLLVLSINMHAMFNGKIFKTILNKNEERK